MITCERCEILRCSPTEKLHRELFSFEKQWQREQKFKRSHALQLALIVALNPLDIISRKYYKLK